MNVVRGEIVTRTAYGGLLGAVKARMYGPVVDSGGSLRSPGILLVGHLLHPLDDLAVEVLQDGEMGHRGRGRGAVPVPLARRDGHDVSRPDLLDGSTFDLHAPDA